MSADHVFPSTVGVNDATANLSPAAKRFRWHDAVLYDKRLTPAERCVVLAVDERTDRATGEAKVDQRWLANKLGLGFRVITSAVKKGVALGYISVQRFARRRDGCVYLVRYANAARMTALKPECCSNDTHGARPVNARADNSNAAQIDNSMPHVRQHITLKRITPSDSPSQTRAASSKANGLSTRPDLTLKRHTNVKSQKGLGKGSTRQAPTITGDEQFAARFEQAVVDCQMRLRVGLSTKWINSDVQAEARRREFGEQDE